MKDFQVLSLLHDATYDDEYYIFPCLEIYDYHYI